MQYKSTSANLIAMIHAQHQPHHPRFAFLQDVQAGQKYSSFPLLPIHLRIRPWLMMA